MEKKKIVSIIVISVNVLILLANIVFYAQNWIKNDRETHQASAVEWTKREIISIIETSGNVQIETTDGKKEVLIRAPQVDQPALENVNE